MSKKLIAHLNSEIEQTRAAGLFKSERIITTPQRADIHVSTGEDVLNFCANNYLGLADNQEIVDAGKDTLDTYKAGMASVRFICGTLDLHKNLEARVAKFKRQEDAILYSSCFDANTGLFETILGKGDALISDQLNHASIIDGVRLCKADRYRYKNNDMADLERCLKEAQDARFRLIATDGVFSMDGYLVNLPEVCALAKKYDALVMIDDSHAVGFMGPGGGGTADYYGLTEEVDIITGTFGKALGGASGGYTAANATIVEWLRQRSRPYLFSNTLAPVIAGMTVKALDILESAEGDKMRATLQDNAQYFRAKMTAAGFDLLPGDHPIIPVMLYDAPLAAKFADEMLKRGIYVTAFSFPVVPKEQARIRTQMSCAHSRDHLDTAIAAFIDVGNALCVLKKAA